MPMLVTFKKRHAGALSVGPFKALCFEGAELRAGDGDGGEPIARHEKHQWQVHGEEFLRLDCDGPLTLVFLDGAGKASRQFGPCAHFSSVGGIAYRDHEVFCHLDEQTNRWYVPVERREWAVLLVEEAPGGRAGAQ
jgi:hypothetical protein